MVKCNKCFLKKKQYIFHFNMITRGGGDCSTRGENNCIVRRGGEYVRDKQFCNKNVVYEKANNINESYCKLLLSDSDVLEIIF